MGQGRGPGFSGTDSAKKGAEPRFGEIGPDYKKLTTRQFLQGPLEDED